MLGGWGMRSLFLAVPLVLSILAPWWGVQGWMVHALVWSVFFFCFFRSIGAAAIIPWLYSILPAGVRGRYFGSDQFLSGIAGVLTLICCSALFALLPVYTALLVQYGIALLGSTLSYHALKKLPDAPKPTAISLRTVAKGKPAPHVPAVTIPQLPVAGGLVFRAVDSDPAVCRLLPEGGTRTIAGEHHVVRGGAVPRRIAAAWALKRRVDATGAKPFLLLGLGLYAIVAVYWWVYLKIDSQAIAGVFAVYFLLGLGTACWTIANLNYLPQVTGDTERTLIVSIHGAVTACIGGMAPILWGWFLKGSGGGGPAINVNVFQWFFLSVLVSVVCLFLAGGPVARGQIDRGGAARHWQRRPASVSRRHLSDQSDRPEEPSGARAARRIVTETAAGTLKKGFAPEEVFGEPRTAAWPTFASPIALLIKSPLAR